MIFTIRFDSIQPVTDKLSVIKDNKSDVIENMFKHHDNVLGSCASLRAKAFEFL